MNFPSTAQLPARNIPGICTVDVIDVRNAVNVPYQQNGHIDTDVELAGGVSYVRIRFGSAKGGHFSEKMELVNGAQCCKSLLTGALEKDQVDKLAPLLAAKKARFLLLLTTHNGDQLLMGTKEEGCQLVVTDRMVGDDGTPFAGYQLRGTLARLEPVPFYLGTAPENVLVAECPTLAQLLVGVDGADAFALFNWEQQQAAVNSITMAMLWLYLTEPHQTQLLTAAGATVISTVDGGDLWGMLDGTQQAALLAAAGVTEVDGIDTTGEPYDDVTIG